MTSPARSDDPYDECFCGDYRHQHHDLGCTRCPSPGHADSCRRFRLAYRPGQREAARRVVAEVRTTVRPGGGSALLQGCSCEFAENRGGRGVGGLVVGIDKDGVAHRIKGIAYMVRKGCPVHDPRTPWWVMPGLLMSGGGSSFAVSTALSFAWPPLAASTTGLLTGIVTMLGCARWYDVRQKKRGSRHGSV